MSIDLPFSFNRIYKGAPAEGMVFTSTTNLNNYLTNPIRYAGQIVALVEGGVVTAYKLNATEDAWEELGSGSGGTTIADWATATAYVTGDWVTESNKLYKALTDHTSGTFATDLANGDWVEISATSPSSMQDAYDNSTSPQVVIDSGRGGVEFRNKTVDDGSNVFRVSSNDGVDTYFSVNSTATYADKYSFTGGTGELQASTLNNVLVKDASGTHLLKKESGELYFNDFKNVLPTDVFTLSAGTNVTDNTTTPLVGVREALFTQFGASVGEGNEFVIALPSAKNDWIRDFIKFEILTNLVGESGDYNIKIKESPTNGAFQDVITHSIKSGVSLNKIRVKLKEDTNYVLVRFEIAAVNNANTLTVARVNVTDKGFDVGQMTIEGEYYATNAVATRPSVNSYSAQFSNVLINDLNGLATVTNDGTSGVVLTALKDITGVARSLVADNTATMSMGFVKDGDTTVAFTDASNDNKRYGYAVNTTGNPNDAAQVPFSLKEGQTLKLSTQTNNTLYSGGVNFAQNIHFLIQGNTDAVVEYDGEDNVDTVIRYTGTTNALAITAFNDNIPFLTKVKDTKDEWDGSEFTAKSKGNYTFTGTIELSAAATGSVLLYKNGGYYSYIDGVSSSNSWGFSGSVYLQKDESFSIRADTGITLNNATTHNIDINRETKNNIVQLPLGGDNYPVAITSKHSETISNSSGTVLFDGSPEFGGNISSNNGTFLQIPRDGWYNIDFTADSPSSSDANFFVDLRRSSTTPVSTSSGTSFKNSNGPTFSRTGVTRQAFAKPLYFTKGEYIFATGQTNSTSGPFIITVRLTSVNEPSGTLVNQSDLMKYYATETHVGYWKDNKKLYARSFTVASDIALSGAISGWNIGAGNTIKDGQKASGSAWILPVASYQNATGGASFLYRGTTGDIEADIYGGRTVYAGTTFTIEYTKD